MKANIDQPRDPESKHKNPEPRLVSKPDSKDDLKSLPLPEVEKRLGSSAKGTEPSRGAETAGAIWSE
jgi:H+-transporting ATPase